MVQQIVQMVEEIKACQAAGATTACLVQIYVYIDALAYINMPITRSKNTKIDFINWVNKYLKAHPSQTYQYRGIDIYGARCALLHAFSSEAAFHQESPDTIRFVYTDGGKHVFKSKVDSTLAIIGIVSLINDFIIGVGNFLKDLHSRIADSSEKSIIQKRMNKIFAIIPFPSQKNLQIDF